MTPVGPWSIPSRPQPLDVLWQENGRLQRALCDALERVEAANLELAATNVELAATNDELKAVLAELVVARLPAGC